MMRRAAGICFFAIAFVLFFTSVGFADDNWPVGMWGIGPRISYYDLQDHDLTQDTEINITGSALFEGNLTWFARKWLSLEFSGGYVKSNADVHYGDQRPDIGEIEQIPLLLTARFHLWHPKMGGTFYGGGGVGYYLNDFKISDDLSGVLAPIGYTISMDNSFGMHLAVGFEGFITKNWCINGDLKYIWNEADFTESAPGYFSMEDSIDLRALVFGVGFKYYF